ncbi:UNKNOWN [Stylonychia lemnae]|uniref:Uncharacterized protein n=1 Tax=Stylonychia lemnae TaxID=5949 RepID=A0A078AAE9_STYLE|nr:UNKNOWN [Stylonychia lemnae]|eukprot:CDW79169.1 UNKNOWN [Stylonychia lemnae]
MWEEINSIEKALVFKQLVLYIIADDDKADSDIGKSKRKSECGLFLNADGTLSTAPSELEDTILVYKIDIRSKKLSMAVSFIVFQHLSALINFDALLKVNHDKQGEGMSLAFFCDLAEYIKNETRCKLNSGSYFVVHQVKALKSHAFYEKLRLVAAPLTMQSWKMEDLAQAKKNACKEEVKSEDDVEEGNPQIEPESLITTKSMSRRDKHCYFETCGGKLITGLNRARHLKNFKLDGIDKSLYSLYKSNMSKCDICIRLKEVERPVMKKTKNKMAFYICSIYIHPAIGMTKQKVFEIQEDDLTFYRNEKDVLSKHQTLSRNLTSMLPLFLIDNAKSQGNTNSFISQEESGLITLSNILQMVSISKEDILIISKDVLRVSFLFVNIYPYQVGLIATVFILGQSCWQSAVNALNIKQENSDLLWNNSLLILTTAYDSRTAKWYKQYWKYSTDQQIDLCKYFKSIGHSQMSCRIYMAYSKKLKEDITQSEDCMLAVAIDMIYLLSGLSEIINIVFPKEHLMNRDMTEFELLITLSSMAEDKVRYRAIIDDFIPEKNSLIIVDEVDIFLLDDLCKFKAVIVANAFIGLTETTANTRRSFDNRSNMLPITLDIAQSFLIKGGAVQAFNRVGRLLAKPDAVKLQKIVVKKATNKYKGKSLLRENKLLGQGARKRQQQAL